MSGATWTHEQGDQYFVVASQVVGNDEFGFHNEHHRASVNVGDLDKAIREGFRLSRLDDFNIGVIRDGQLVALLWMDQIVDNEPGVLWRIAENLEGRRA